MDFIPGSWVPVRTASFHDLERMRAVKVIVFGNEAFDWGFDETTMAMAREKANGDESTLFAVEATIRTHFEASLSQFVGRPVTVAEIVQALADGGIKV